MSPSAIGRPCQTAAAAASEERYNGRRDAGWSSQVARRAHNPEVAGSNPAPATAEGPGNGVFCFSCWRPARTGSMAQIRKAHRDEGTTEALQAEVGDRLASDVLVERR